MDKKIWLSSPHMGEKELANVIRVFESNWIAPVGSDINNFEKEVASYLNVKEAVALSCGTAAIHLALIMLGVTNGDTVLCQSFTFCGSANPIIYCGAEPVFIDSEEDTWNMDPKLLENALLDYQEKGQLPKAVIVVHLYGQPAKMMEINSICKRFNVPIIEDAAESLGSELDGVKTGSFGDIAILSFNGNKIITTSSGGMLVTNNIEWAAQARHLSTQARDEAPYYEHSTIGFNYRMSNVLAAIGRGQLNVLADRVKRKREIFQLYFDELSDINGLCFQTEVRGSFSNRWLTTIFLSEEYKGEANLENIRIELAELNIESRPLWKPMHLQPVFKNCKAYANGVSENLFKSGLCLPSDTNMSLSEQKKIIKYIKEILGE